MSESKLQQLKEEECQLLETMMLLERGGDAVSLSEYERLAYEKNLEIKAEHDKLMAMGSDAKLTSKKPFGGASGRLALTTQYTSPISTQFPSYDTDLDDKIKKTQALIVELDEELMNLMIEDRPASERDRKNAEKMTVMEGLAQLKRRKRQAETNPNDAKIAELKTKLNLLVEEKTEMENQIAAVITQINALDNNWKDKKINTQRALDDFDDADEQARLYTGINERRKRYHQSVADGAVYSRVIPPGGAQTSYDGNW